MMTSENSIKLLQLLERHKELNIASQIDYDKFYLYSIIVHSTAIEGSTVTEVEAQLLFDEGITSSKRTMMEQMMNLDLKTAYEYGREWIKRHEPITVDWLITLASKVMVHTGSEYSAMGGDFSAAKPSTSLRACSRSRCMTTAALVVQLPMALLATTATTAAAISP